jgi:uncharacterized cupredoxin-like copper-binding protein/predicted small secreted protein
MLKRLSLLFSVIVVAGISLAGCSSSPGSAADNKQANKDVSEGKQEQVDQSKDKKTDDIRTITITATEFSFGPQEITVKKGEKVEIILKNQGTAFHDWVIKKIPVKKLAKENNEHGHSDQQDLAEGSKDHEHDHNHEVTVHTSAYPEKSESIIFIPKETGQYTFYCSVSGHRQAGMEGLIKVVQ